MNTYTRCNVYSAYFTYSAVILKSDVMKLLQVLLQFKKLKHINQYNKYRDQLEDLYIVTFLNKKELIELLHKLNIQEQEFAPGYVDTTSFNECTDFKIIERYI